MTTGPEGRLPAERAYRLSDQERDEAIAALGDAYAEGRLDDAEFRTRLELAGRAVLATDLDPLFADLPRRRPSRPNPEAEQQRAPRRGDVGPHRGHHGHHRGHPMMLAPVLLVVLALATQTWILLPVAFLLASVRRRAWAGASVRPGGAGSLGPGAHGCGRR